MLMVVVVMMVVLMTVMMMMMTVVAAFNHDDYGAGGDADGDDNDGDGGHHLGPCLPHGGGKEACQLLGHRVAKDNRGRLETFKESKPSVHHLVLCDTLDLNIVLPLLLVGEEEPS